jgi:hypothetical protein
LVDILVPLNISSKSPRYHKVIAKLALHPVILLNFHPLSGYLK